jgi:uncharacterized protein with PIN domain
MPRLTELLAGKLPLRSDDTCPVCEERLATVTVEFRVEATRYASAHHVETTVCQPCAEDLLTSLTNVLGVPRCRSS